MKLAWNFYVLWAVLCGIVVLKSLAIRDMSGADWFFLALYLVGMLAASLVAAWIAWRVTGKKKPMELTYLGVMAVLFLIETVRLYREGFAGRE